MTIRDRGETTGTSLRWPQHLASHVASFDVRYEAAALLGEARYLPDRRSAKTLIHLPHMRMTLTAMCAGVSTGWHATHAPISVQCLGGLARLRTRENEYELTEDIVVTLDSDVEHDLAALTDSALLLTFAWTSEAAASAEAAMLEHHPASARRVYEPAPVTTGDGNK